MLVLLDQIFQYHIVALNAPLGVLDGLFSMSSIMSSTFDTFKIQIEVVLLILFSDALHRAYLLLFLFGHPVPYFIYVHESYEQFISYSRSHHCFFKNSD